MSNRFVSTAYKPFMAGYSVIMSRNHALSPGVDYFMASSIDACSSDQIACWSYQERNASLSRGASVRVLQPEDRSSLEFNLMLVAAA